MASFKQFLKEATKKDKIPKNVIKQWKSQDVDIDKMIKFINTNCRMALRGIEMKNGLIYRGFASSPGNGAVVLDSSTGVRMSKDSNNLYQLMMDRSSDLQDIPSRSKSFICSTHPAAAMSYGSRDRTYVMLPIDGTDIAFVPNVDDFITSTVSANKVLGTSRTHIDFLSSECGVFLTKCGLAPDSGNKYSDADKINTALSKLPIELVALAFSFNEIFDAQVIKWSEARKRWRDSDDANDLAKWTAVSWIENESFKACKGRALTNLINVLRSDLTTPEFKRLLLTFSKFNHSKLFDEIASLLMTKSSLHLDVVSAGSQIYHDTECWFSGKCLAVPIEIFAKMLKKMQEINDRKINSDVLDFFETEFDFETL